MSRIPVFAMLLAALAVGAVSHTVGGIFLFTFWPVATPTAPTSVYWWFGGFIVIAVLAVALTGFIVFEAARRRSAR